MPIRRKRQASSTTNEAEQPTAADEPETADGDEAADLAADLTADDRDDDSADTDEADADDVDAATDGDGVEDDDELEDDELDDTDDDEGESQRGGVLGWLLPRKKKIDYGEDYAVHVATLPDLERFPEDGHVHPEIVRSWMALQQFGEAMLLVSWYRRRPAGYVMVSWTGDWNDAVRKKHPNVPALCNLWVDQEHAEHGVERTLVEAALKAVRNQGSRSVVTCVDTEDESAAELYEDLGFDDTGDRTQDAYIYRDTEGKKRKGRHHSSVLMKKF